MSSKFAAAWLAFATASAPGPGAAQQRIFPDVPSLERPEASPRVHGLAARLLSIRRGESRFGQEPEAEVALGENFPIVGLSGTAVFGTWALTLEAYHESSQLGDEYEDRFGAKRVDWTRKVAGAWVSYTTVLLGREPIRGGGGAVRPLRAPLRQAAVSHRFIG